MRTYNDHVMFFDREIDRIGRAPFGLSLRSFLAVMARDGTPEADAACRAFAATLEWPPLTEELRAEIGLRLVCAREWCADVTGAEGDGDEDGQEFLRSILIEYWQDCGRENWLWNWLVKQNES